MSVAVRKRQRQLVSREFSAAAAKYVDVFFDNIRREQVSQRLGPRPQWQSNGSDTDLVCSSERAGWEQAQYTTRARRRRTCEFEPLSRWGYC